MFVLPESLLISFTSYIDESAKEKFVPYATLTGDESYQSRDLEKVFDFFNVYIYVFAVKIDYSKFSS